MVVRLTQSVRIIHSPHGHSQLFIHCLPTLCSSIYGHQVAQEKKTSSCTTAGFSHSTTTTKLNYKAALAFPWSSNHVWLGHLELTLLWFRSASLNDSPDTQTAAAAANMLRIHRRQATQLGRGDTSREEDNSNVSLLYNLTLGSYFVVQLNLGFTLRGRLEEHVSTLPFTQSYLVRRRQS